MDYDNYSTEGSSVPGGFKNIGSGLTYGCSQSDVRHGPLLLNPPGTEELSVE